MGPQRKGMTLIEVLIALIILVSVMVSLGVFAGRFTAASSRASTRSTAVELAADRLERVKGSLTYAAVDSMAGTEKAPSGLTGFTRQTMITRVGGTPSDTVDYKIVTVFVTAPGITNPIAKTTVISDF
jgi:prepilin-type N-terminal cleavage/methylation domain-containing protein